MFDKEYSFKGTHAEKVIKLRAKFSDDISTGILASSVLIYTIAPIIGFLYNRKSEMDKTSNETTKIFPQEIANHKTNLQYNYQLIMLLDEKYETSFENRIDKAFRLYGSAAAANDELLFESYVRGGIDVLYGKLIDGANNSDDYVKKLYDFMEEFDERYNEKVSTDSILDLCRLARS